MNVPALSALRSQYAEDDALAISVTAGHVTVKPFSGLTVGVSTTVPAKLSVLVRLTEINAFGPPTLKLTGPCIEMMKSPP